MTSAPNLQQSTTSMDHAPRVWTYGWWKFQGWATLVINPLFFLAWHFNGDLERYPILPLFVILGLFLGICVLFWQKWAMVTLTVLSLNPILWIINGIYLSNRWNDPLINGGAAPKPGQQIPVSTSPAVVSESLQAPIGSAVAEPVMDASKGLGEPAAAPTTAEEEALWTAALKEVDGPDRRPGLWAKLFAQANGDEAKAKAAYLRTRVSEMAGDRHQ